MVLQDHQMMWKKEKLTDCDIILGKKYINGGFLRPVA